MLKLMLCLAGLGAIVLVNEFLWRKKILHGELKRKFTHMLSMSFVAFWPWLISWEAIQLIGLLMVIVLLVNRQIKTLHYLGSIRTKTYGDVFLALAVTICASITDQKIFFAIAILNVALADGLAAVIGTKFGGKWKYQVFHHNKTVIGSMTFWLTSLCILGVGLVTTNDAMLFSHYATLLIFLPPVLTLVENIAGLGLDNLAVPIVTIAVLQAFS